MNPNDHSAQLERVRRKVREAREIGWENRSADHRHFRVEAHELRYATPLTEAVVAAFEGRHGITLPPDYRAFITTLASSGGGPYYGLRPLEGALDLAEAVDGFLGSPSPLVPGVDYTDAWCDERGVEDEPFRGILTIADQGSGGVCGLVVTGAGRGRVVYVGDGPPYFVHDACFLDWYERWLDDLIADVPTTDFGYTRSGTPDELVASYPDARCVYERTEILASFSRHHSWPEEALRLVLAESQASNPRVRATAIGSLAACGTAGRAAVVRALDDADEAARHAAVRALVRMGVVAQETASLRRALRRESRADVMFSIASALHDASLLEPKHLTASITSPSLGIRQYAGHFLAKMGRIDGALGVERLLLDDDLHVRLYAVSACEKAGLEHAIELLRKRPNGTAAIEALLRQRARAQAVGRSQSSWWRRLFG